MIEIIIDKTKATHQKVYAIVTPPEYQALIGEIKWPVRMPLIEECPEIPAAQTKAGKVLDE